MNTLANITGYPSIDRPQDRYYRKAPVRELNVEQTIYELVFNSNKGNMDSPALKFINVEWSFAKLKEETDRAAGAFVKLGLKCGDVVLIGVSNSPEIVVTLLALNKIGVISKWFDIRASEKDIEEYANESNCKQLVCFDILIPRIQLILDNTKIQKVIVIDPMGSLSAPMRFTGRIKAKQEGNSFELPRDRRYILFKDFVKTGSSSSDIPCVAFEKNRASIMIQSSGTTGKPKTIVHSDYSATEMSKKLAYSDMPLGLGKSMLVFLPPWIAYALGDSIIMSLATGTKVVLSPTFNPEDVMKYIGEFTIAFSAPIVYRYLRDKFNSLTSKQRDGLSKIECLVTGGDKISVEENKEIEQLVGKTLINGYGNNEGWGALTVNPVNHNKYGTIGVPMYGTTIISYDNDTGKELKYGEVGEICSLTDTMFMYYESHPEETAAVKKLHADGKVWLHTGDLGFVDEDGFVTLKGRLRRVIICRAFKISAYTIEDKICEHPAVKECVAVEVEDKIDEHVPMAYIVLKDEYVAQAAALETEIREKCRNELKDYEVPKWFRLVDALPYTQNNKYDFRLLEQQGNEYVRQQKE